MLGNILRGDLGLSEIEDSLGIRVVRGDRGDGRGAALGISAGVTSRTNPNGSTGTTFGSDGRPAVHQNGTVSSTFVFGNQVIPESLCQMTPTSSLRALQLQHLASSPTNC